MLVTGIVEDALAAKSKAKASRQQKNRDTLTGLRLMELGRATLVGGVWGVLGLRRRIMVRCYLILRKLENLLTLVV